ncbi:rho gtpase activation protein [Lichtheimia corymbifera JMRC:FSU:9682]|uniref:Rho gtpase activation protein n=1 Tax=Lichtheimia corymbifera JMRC:FSU:9682 TaxID=1263082 RepID=A0A068SE01_9FUNG|nr:rho gtpase activation protein [Lichtheimia corymbifera JMRC:FSU:9682]
MTTVAYDWVQVVHPDSKDIYFVNPTTGKCLTDKPEQGIIKPNDPNGEWWELWDDANDMPYYYHTTSGQAHWNQPADTPVISLTNTDIRLEQVVPEAGSSVLKRNSRSLDLPSTRSIPPTTAYHHTRSTSDGNNTATPPSPPPPPPPPMMTTTTTTTTTTTNTSPLCIQEESHDSLSAALPNGSMGLFGFRWTRKQSVVSEMGDLAAARQRRLSNFSAFRGKTSSSWKNLVTRTQSSPRNSIAVSTPVSNPEAAAAMHPTKWMDPFSLQAQTEKKPILPTNLQQEITQFAIDGFAQKYFAKHKRGIIFKRQVPMEEMLRWTKESLKQPLIMLNKDLYKDALKCFKLIQIIMGDRPRPRQSTEIEEYQTLLGCGISKGQMRDEIYVQVCKQLNNNPNGQSIRKGWEILCVISVTFPPSKNLESYLNNFVDQSTHVTQNQVDVISQYVSTRLKRICARGAKGKVLTAAEIERAKEAPFKPSIFGEDLELIISLPSHCDNGLKIPKIVPFLADAVLKMNGLQSEGIFRVPGDAEEVTDLRVRIENGNYDSSGITDPNVPASLLKYWLRDLEKPLIPTELYDECVKFAENSDEAIAIVNALPDLNRRIVMYMIASVQEFNREEVTQYTRMNVNNLAMVFAPNFLRCPSDSLTTVFQNSKYEQAFVRTLINDMQTEKESCAYGDEAPLAKKRCSDD